MSTATHKKLLTVSELAKFRKCSTRTIFRFIVQQKLPEPIYIDGISLWPTKEIERWVEVGCPSRKTWNVVKQLEEQLRAAKANKPQKKKKLS